MTTTGIGDVILRGRYYIVEEQDYVPRIAVVTARFKFPTATASQGLGTGKFDHGYGIEMSKLIGQKWLVFLTAGITSSATLTWPMGPVHWAFATNIGGRGHRLLRDARPADQHLFRGIPCTSAGLAECQRCILLVELSALSSLAPEWRRAVGLSNGAPDYVVSIGTSYRF
ncbi:MAG: hypothetical protein U0236_21690 [Nitrospira sp.]